MATSGNTSNVLGLDDPEKMMTPEQIQLFQGGLRAMGYPISDINGIAGQETQNAFKQFIKDKNLSMDTDMDQEALSAVQQQIQRDRVANQKLLDMSADPASLGSMDQLMMQITLVLKGFLSAFGDSFSPKIQSGLNNFINTLEKNTHKPEAARPQDKTAPAATVSNDPANRLDAYIDKYAGGLDKNEQFQLKEKIDFLGGGPYDVEIPRVVEGENDDFMKANPDAHISGYDALVVSDQLGLYALDDLRADISKATKIPANNIELDIKFTSGNEDLKSISYRDNRSPDNKPAELSETDMDILNGKLDWVQQNYPPLKAFLEDHNLPTYTYKTPEAKTAPAPTPKKQEPVDITKLGIAEAVAYKNGLDINDEKLMDRIATAAGSTNASRFSGPPLDSDYRPDGAQMKDAYMELHGQNLTDDQKAVLGEAIEKYESIEVSQGEVDQYIEAQKDQAIAGWRDHLVDKGIISETGKTLKADKLNDFLRPRINDAYVAEIRVRDAKFAEQYPDAKHPGELTKEMNGSHYGLDRGTAMIHAAADIASKEYIEEQKAAAAQKQEQKPPAQDNKTQDNKAQDNTGKTATVTSTDTVVEHDDLTTNPIEASCGRLGNIFMQSACEEKFRAHQQKLAEEAVMKSQQDTTVTNSAPALGG